MLLGLLKPSAGEIKINNMSFEKNRIEILKNKFYISLYRITKKTNSKAKFNSIWKII